MALWTVGINLVFENVVRRPSYDGIDGHLFVDRFSHKDERRMR